MDELTTTKDMYNATISEKYYDTFGAVTYIACVVIWYSIGIIGILITKFKNEIGKKKKKQTLAQMQTPYIKSSFASTCEHLRTLETLADQNFRSKAWRTYFGDNYENILVNEQSTIGCIQKRISLLHRKLGSVSFDTDKPVVKHKSSFHSKIGPLMKRNILERKYLRKSHFRRSSLQEDSVTTVDGFFDSEKTSHCPCNKRPTIRKSLSEDNSAQCIEGFHPDFIRHLEQVRQCSNVDSVSSVSTVIYKENQRKASEVFEVADC